MRLKNFKLYLAISISVSTTRTDPQNVTYLMKGATGSFDIPVTSSLYVKLNAGQYGFYRVLYDETEWNKMMAALENLSLDPIDRAGLLDDAFNLARAGNMPYERAMAIIGEKNIPFEIEKKIETQILIV